MQQVDLRSQIYFYSSERMENKVMAQLPTGVWFQVYETLKTGLRRGIMGGDYDDITLTDCLLRGVESEIARV